jgi:hypothetical protein
MIFFRFPTTTSTCWGYSIQTSVSLIWLGSFSYSQGRLEVFHLLNQSRRQRAAHVTYCHSPRGSVHLSNSVWVTSLNQGRDFHRPTTFSTNRSPLRISTHSLFILFLILFFSGLYFGSGQSHACSRILSAVGKIDKF